MCVLFNMAAMQSGVAAQEPLDTEDSLKLAAKLFQVTAYFSIGGCAPKDMYMKILLSKFYDIKNKDRK